MLLLLGSMCRIRHVREQLAVNRTELVPQRLRLAQGFRKRNETFYALHASSPAPVYIRLCGSRQYTSIEVLYVAPASIHPGYQYMRSMTYTCTIDTRVQ